MRRTQLALASLAVIRNSRKCPKRNQIFNSLRTEASGTVSSCGHPRRLSGRLFPEGAMWKAVAKFPKSSSSRSKLTGRLLVVSRRVWVHRTVSLSLGFLNTHTHMHARVLFLLCGVNYSVSVLWSCPPQLRNVTVLSPAHVRDDQVHGTWHAASLFCNISCSSGEAPESVIYMPQKEVCIAARGGAYIKGDSFVNVLFIPSTHFQQRSNCRNTGKTFLLWHLCSFIPNIFTGGGVLFIKNW